MVVIKYKEDWNSEGSSEPEEEKNLQDSSTRMVHQNLRWRRTRRSAPPPFSLSGFLNPSNSSEFFDYILPQSFISKSNGVLFLSQV
jgi:hypothetical protein